MNRQVVGFLFSPNREQVVLILKNRPSWQKGLLNGVGGHCIENEIARDAMIREFKEETGVLIGNWTCFAVGINTEDTVEVLFYKAFNKEYENVKSVTDEELYIIDVNDFIRNAENFPSIFNIRWLIQLALDDKTSGTCFEFNLNK